MTVVPLTLPVRSTPPRLDQNLSLECALEALLFIAKEPISLARFSELTGASEAMVKKTLTHLKRRYRHRGIVIKRTYAGYAFAIASCAQTVVAHYQSEFRTLSDEATHILALIAYLQPISPVQLSDYLTNAPEHALGTLLAATLIAITDDEHKQYITTPRFLESAGLASLDELPLIAEEDLAAHASEDDIASLP